MQYCTQSMSPRSRLTHQAGWTGMAFPMSMGSGPVFFSKARLVVVAPSKRLVQIAHSANRHTYKFSSPLSYVTLPQLERGYCRALPHCLSVKPVYSCLLALHVKHIPSICRYLTSSSAPSTTSNLGQTIPKMVLKSNSSAENGSPRRKSAAQESLPDSVLLGSIDQGTTSSRFLIFDTDGDLVAGHQMDFENLYPHSG